MAGKTESKRMGQLDLKSAPLSDMPLFVKLITERGAAQDSSSKGQVGAKRWKWTVFVFGCKVTHDI